MEGGGGGSERRGAAFAIAAASDSSPSSTSSTSWTSSSVPSFGDAKNSSSRFEDPESRVVIAASFGVIRAKLAQPAHRHRLLHRGLEFSRAGDLAHGPIFARSYELMARRMLCFSKSLASAA